MEATHPPVFRCQVQPSPALTALTVQSGPYSSGSVRLHPYHTVSITVAPLDIFTSANVMPPDLFFFKTVLVT